jgi:hypothetical protein
MRAILRSRLAWRNAGMQNVPYCFNRPHRSSRWVRKPIQSHSIWKAASALRLLACPGGLSPYGTLERRSGYTLPTPPETFKCTRLR